jgi:hypothetical protein
LIIRQRRIELQTDFSGCRRPLGAQMVGRTHDQHTHSGSFGQKLMSNAQGKAGFPRRRRHGKEVPV